jgi:hypothetical protein
VGTIILSAIVAHTAWHWMLDRGGVLRQYRFEWPAFDATLLAPILRWLILFMILGGLLWLIRMASRWLSARFAPTERKSGALAAAPILNPTESESSAESLISPN